MLERSRLVNSLIASPVRAEMMEPVTVSRSEPAQREIHVGLEDVSTAVLLVPCQANDRPLCRAENREGTLTVAGELAGNGVPGQIFS